MIIFPNIRSSFLHKKSLPSDSFVWLDASSSSTMFIDNGVTKVSTDNDRIYQWNDKNGNISWTQTNVSYRPYWKSKSNIISVNNNSVVQFNNISSSNYNYMTTSQYVGTYLTAGITTFMVTKEITGSSSWGGGWIVLALRFWVIGYNNGNLFLHGNRVGWSQGNNTYLAINTPISTNNITLITSVGTANIYGGITNQLIRRNSTDIATAFKLIDTSSNEIGPTLLCPNTHGSYSSGYNGPFCELIIFKRKLSISEYSSIENYLIGKWGIT